MSELVRRHQKIVPPSERIRLKAENLQLNLYRLLMCFINYTPYVNNVVRFHKKIKKKRIRRTNHIEGELQF